jgi:hypothetical protein
VRCGAGRIVYTHSRNGAKQSEEISEEQKDLEETMPYISGNAVAVGARLSLFSIRQSSAVGQTPIITFSDSSGNFVFTNIAPGDYRLTADCSSANAPHNTGY